MPYWELNGDRLSKSDDCRAATDRTAAQITENNCIVTQFGNTATIRFHNVIKDQFNVYVHVNGNQVISEPDNTALAGSITLDLQDGDNDVVKVRLASKTGTHFAENYGTDRFHYKVLGSDCAVEGALRFNGSLSAIDVVVGDSAGTTVTLPAWSGPVCRALFYSSAIATRTTWMCSVATAFPALPA